jgi:hypothetical protein
MNRVYVLLALILAAGCREPELILRPGCRLRVVDDVSGLPLSDVKMTVMTIQAGADTVRRWSFATDEDGVVGFGSERVRRREEKAAGRDKGPYECVVACECTGYQYFSQRITRPAHTIRMTRGFLIAYR